MCHNIQDHKTLTLPIWGLLKNPYRVLFKNAQVQGAQKSNREAYMEIR